jgi:TRAP-type C4-dicarboxylate transport system permease small subunit
VAAAALVILMMVTVLDVFMRYLFNRPIRASLDTVEVMLLVFVFNGMAAAFFGRRHIVIDLLDGLFGPRLTGLLIRIADVLSVLCVGLLMWAMVLPASQAYQYGDTKMELPIPIYVLWIVALLSFAGTFFWSRC